MLIKHFLRIIYTRFSFRGQGTKNFCNLPQNICLIFAKPFSDWYYMTYITFSGGEISPQFPLVMNHFIWKKEKRCYGL